MTVSSPRSSVSAHSFSRRTLLGSSLAVATVLPLGDSAAFRVRYAVSTSTATWHSWVLTTPDELRPAAPTVPNPAGIA